MALVVPAPVAFSICFIGLRPLTIACNLRDNSLKARTQAAPRSFARIFVSMNRKIGRPISHKTEITTPMREQGIGA